MKTCNPSFQEAEAGRAQIQGQQGCTEEPSTDTKGWKERERKQQSKIPTAQYRTQGENTENSALFYILLELGNEMFKSEYLT